MRGPGGPQEKEVGREGGKAQSGTIVRGGPVFDIIVEPVSDLSGARAKGCRNDQRGKGLWGRRGTAAPTKR